MTSPEVHVVSISGGKDSQATAMIALKRLPRDEVRLVFADTGNEHPLTYEHLDYLEEAFAHPIVRLKADFSGDFDRRRQFIAEKWPEQGIEPEIVANALGVMRPTGNPFLDLCLLKNRFPSRLAQFCTQELKRRPLDKFLLDAWAPGVKLFSWQGVRRDESESRKTALEIEDTPEGWTIIRPIATWTAQQTVDFCVAGGVRVNPLYSRGMTRVGCMPCINCSKQELSEISNRFPEVIDRIREWERIVSLASKRAGGQPFFRARGGDELDFTGSNIDERVRWARTSRGGRQFDLLKVASDVCSSSYGLCEQGG